MNASAVSRAVSRIAVSRLLAALALVAGIATTAWAGADPLRVALMPSYRQQATYGNALINEPITVWGRTWGGTGSYTYTLDFGDGSVPASGAVTDPKFIGQPHTYTSGGNKTVTLTIVSGAETRSGQAVIHVALMPTFELRVDQASEKGLIWIYRNQTAVTASSVKWTYGNSDSYELPIAGFSLLAFEENGHLASYNDEDDIYAETVRKGLNYLLGKVARSAISVQSGGNPDSNGNGYGAYFFNNTYSDAIPAAALIMSVTSQAAASNTTVQTGLYTGQSLLTLVRDLLDQLSFCQGEGADLGGWRYNVLSASNDGYYDGSAQQWACLDFLIARDRWGLAAPNWVAANAVTAYRALQDASGGCHYQSLTDGGCDNVAKTAGMLNGYRLGGMEKTNAWVAAGISYISQRWHLHNYNRGFSSSGSGGWAGDFYAMYAIKKGFYLHKVDTINTALGVRDWYHDIAVWLLGIQPGSADALAGLPCATAGLGGDTQRIPSNGFGQNADGSWTTADSYVPKIPSLNTPMAVLMLIKSVTVLGPQAVIAPVTPQPSLRPPRPNPIPFKMDGSGSYHQDRSKLIVQYLWDWDASDGVDLNNPDATGPKVDNPGYRLAGDYAVTLTVIDDSLPPMTNQTTLVVHVTDADVAPIAVTIPPGIPAYAAFPGQPIQLDGSSSYDPDGDTITNYTWDVNCNGIYGDAGDVSGSSPSATVTFASQYIGAIGLQVAANGKTGNSSLSMANLYVTWDDIAVPSFQITNMLAQTYVDVHAVLSNSIASAGLFTNVLVRFYNGNPLHGGSVVSSNFYITLPRGVCVGLNARINLPPGMNPSDVYIYADANDRFPEGNELNNVAQVEPTMERVILSENFEHGGNIPDGWTQICDTNNHLWTFQNGGNNATPPTAHSGYRNAFLFMQATGDHYTKLVTPTFSFDAATNDTKVTFWYTMATNRAQDELRVFYRTSATGAWTRIATFASNVTGWTQAVVSLPNPGQTYSLAFEGNARWGRGVCLDDVVVMGTGPNIVPPVVFFPRTLDDALGLRTYSNQVYARGGDGSYTWTVVSNRLPAGILLRPDGVLTGMPPQVTAATTTVFRVRATDGHNLYGERTYSLTVYPSVAISGRVTYQETTNGLPNITMASSFIDYTDGNGVYTCRVRKGWTGWVQACPPMLYPVPERRAYTNVSANVTGQDFSLWSITNHIPIALCPRALKWAGPSTAWYCPRTAFYGCDSPAQGGSATLSCSLSGPAVLHFDLSMIGADGTNKVTCMVGTQTRCVITNSGSAWTLAIPAGVQTVKWTLTRGARSEATGFSMGAVPTPLTSVSTPAPPDGGTVMRRDFTGVGWRNWSEGTYYAVYAGLTSSSKSLLATNCYGYSVPASNLTARLDAAAGMPIYWRVDNVFQDSFGARVAVPGPVWSFTAVPDGWPCFATNLNTDVVCTLGVYTELGPFSFSTSLTGTVVCALSSGTLPSGMRAVIRGTNLFITGVPAKLGATQFALQLSVKNGTVTQKGMARGFNVCVLPLGLAAGAFDGWLDKSVYGPGVVNVTVNPAGAISGRLSVGGTNYTFTATSFTGTSNGANYVRADLKNGTVVLTPIVIQIGPDGSVKAALERDANAQIVLFRNNWANPGMLAVAREYAGYYTVALSANTNDQTAVSPKGSGFARITILTNGTATVTGVLADGTAFTQTGVPLLFDPANIVDAEVSTGAPVRVAMYAVPTAYSAKGGGVFGVLKVQPGVALVPGLNTIVADTNAPARWWNSDPQSVPGYNPVTGAGGGGFACNRLVVSGGYYDNLLDLRSFYTGQWLDLSARYAPDDYQGYGNGDNYALASEPDTLPVTALERSFLVSSQRLVRTAGSFVDFVRSTNAWNMSVSLDKFTGIINGNFVVYYQNTTAQVARAFSYQGILIPVRAAYPSLDVETTGYEARGYFLGPDKSYYHDGPTTLKSYDFNWSGDVRLESTPIP